MEKQAPKRLIRAMEEGVEVDVEKRVLSRAQFMTRKLATDGGIVVPSGVNTRFFEQNPVVLMMHGFTDQFPVVGRSLGLSATELGMESVTQFADTERGREMAYLYGVNAERQVYARGWSFGWDNVDLEWWSLDHAREWLGDDFDPETVPRHVQINQEVWVARRCIMNEYSAVALGADRDALSRAFSKANIRLAGELVSDMDLSAATGEVAELRKTVSADRARLDKLEKDIQALRGDGASAAARGDSEAVLRELEAIRASLRNV